MEILELQIKHFGKFTDQTIRFHGGINILYGENEAGKSTIHAFLRAMLFDIERQKGRAAKTDEYSLRRPWENPGYFAGTMRFQSGGKIFRLERNFDRQHRVAELICETDGERLSVKDGDLEILLEGMNERAFCNSFLISQSGSVAGENLALELKNYMSNLEYAGDCDLDVAKAITLLEKKQKNLEHERRKAQEEKDKRSREIQLKLDYHEQELRRMQEEERVCLQQEEALRPRQQSENSGKNDSGGKKYVYLAGGFMILALCALFLPGMVFKGVGAALFLMLAFNMLMQSRQMQEEVEVPEEERSRQDWERSCWQLDHIRGKMREQKIRVGNLREEQREQEEGEDFGHLETEIEALRLAAATLQEASGKVYQQWSVRLNQRVSEILSQITEGRYTSIFMDEDLHVRINTPEHLLETWQVSRGTMEQIYFAIRMAAGELLSGGEPMPLILDEVFAMYDEKRLCQTLRWLKDTKKQVLLFTCHKREEELLRTL